MKQPVHDRCAAGIGEQFALIADQAAGGGVKYQTQAMAAGGSHLDHFGFAFAHLLHNDAGMLLVDVDNDLFDRLLPLAGGFVFLQHDAWARHGHFKALAPHGLNQDRELQFAASGNFHGIPVRRFGDAQRDIAFGLAQQPVANHAAGHLVAFGSGERRVVDDERHRNRGRIDGLRLERRIDYGIAEGVGDRALGEPGNRNDVAGFSLIDRGALDAAEGEYLGDAPLFGQLALAAERLDLLIRFDAAGGDAPGNDAAEIGIGLQNGADHPERAFLDGGRRDVAQDQIK